ncbi:MAG: hypothetical protein ACXVC6_00610 [Bacteroidia bacterium]
MKKIFLLGLAATLVFTGCKSKSGSKTKSTAASAEAKPADSFEANLAAAKTRFPDVTMETIKSGHSIYYGACTNCHGPKNINNWNEKEWVGILDEMAKKAKLTAPEKDAVWKYVMSVKLAAK